MRNQPAMPTCLFIYGTLHPGRAPREIAHAARRLTLVGPATIRARVYNLGAYPGAILCDESDEPQSSQHQSDEHQSNQDEGVRPDAAILPGHLFTVPDAETLAALDAYEDFRPASPAASLFLRVDTTATTPDGNTHPCQVYVYNGKPPYR
jgi:gamma-glutamylcyclotransferase (GGCT)/AIG2-like uncharacterized protein YtfP